MIFTRIINVELPENAEVGKGFSVVMEADGEIPFAQIILRHKDGWEWIIRDKNVSYEGQGRCRFTVPPESYHAGTAYLQIEGCCVENIHAASPRDWVIEHRQFFIKDAVVQKPASKPKPTKAKPEPRTPEPKPSTEADLSTSPEKSSAPPQALSENAQAPVIYFGIHKHMHQPYYNTTNTDAWDGQKDDIFGERVGPYTRFIPAAVRQYIDGGLPHAGLSTSWSGSLIEQLNRCAETGRGHGDFEGWSAELREVAQNLTECGNPRVDFTAFGHFHPLMSLIPSRDIIGQIALHREVIRKNFGVEASDVLFPPETAFTPHMIPALKEAGVTAVIYDSIHHFRACKDYPYSGSEEGMLPPNPADRENPEANDWMNLDCIWAPSQISPKLLKPCLLSYRDRKGKTSEIIGIPAERYLGNEDARGGYGALQYELVMGQIYDHIVNSGTFDPQHPPFFVLHSDGDNHGGGADSYYTCNTGRLVEMCKKDPRFQLITIKDYLEKFPVDPENVVHLEPGSWAGADNGDPQFTKWFSRVDQDYSPDLNSWAVLTAFQNVVYTLEDAQQDAGLLTIVKRLLYMAETSCYWYWTGQEEWDILVTDAVNKGMHMLVHAMNRVMKGEHDSTGPTIFVPWVRPANPGGKEWGEHDHLRNAAPEATLNTFIYDVSGIKKATLFFQNADGSNKRWRKLVDQGPYPSATNPKVIANRYQATLPSGSGDIRYHIEALDSLGNVSYSPVGRIYIA
ncbi:MAG: glycosyl hydrolase family 57 [bacterium]|nr:glycosyl hydrolase family 57 [bacterium]